MGGKVLDDEEVKLGYCVGILKPNEVTFTSYEPPKMGEFVLISYEEEGRKVNVLGMVNGIERFDRYISENNSPDYVESILKVYRIGGIFRSKVTLLGNVVTRGGKKRLEKLRYPPVPGAEVYSAPRKLLSEIFADEEGSFVVNIGNLLTAPDIEVGVDISKVISRHLAVLAVTGGGKSNTVSVLLEEVARIGGTALVVDVHGEYIDADFYNSKGERVTNPIDVKINLSTLSPDDIATMSGIDFDRSSRQYYVLMELVECVKKKRREGVLVDTLNDGFNPFDQESYTKPFIDDLLDTLKGLIDYKRGKEGVTEDKFCDFVNTTKPEELTGTYIRLVNLKNKLGDSISDSAESVVDILSRVGMDKINVLNMSGFDYDAMDVIISHTLSAILKERKRWVQKGEGKLPKPILVVIEEAHIFAPKGSYTKTKGVLSKVAREARKFGLGLVLVSQRPKGLDENVLSQMNNWIILRIVEPEDQRHVQRASETLSADLMQYLPSLNPGEAILLGPFVKVPLLVKIRESKARKGGHDIDLSEYWGT